jgi:hypothetical protein
MDTSLAREDSAHSYLKQMGRNRKMVPKTKPNIRVKMIGIRAKLTL